MTQRGRPRKPHTATKQKINKYELLQNEYIEWMLLDKHQKTVAGLPTSDKEWAKVKQITDRTLRMWKNNDAFISKYDIRLKEKQLALPGSTALSTTVQKTSKTPNTEKTEYELIKSKLTERAIAGDKAAAELYFKTYGKQYVDEEAATRKSDFRDLDVAVLYGRVLALVSTEAIEIELAKRKEVVVEE